MKTSLFLSATVALAAAVAGAGCSSLDARQHCELKGPYPGVQHWPKMAHDVLAPEDGGLLLPFVLADLPLSAAYDTLLLPSDIAELRYHRFGCDEGDEP